jgi:transcription-repair coupling factor (superfamily II helicase)
LKIQSNVYEYFLNGFADIIVVRDDVEAKKASDALSLAKVTNYVLPDFRASYGDDLRSFESELKQINNALSKFYTHKNAVLVAPFKTLSHKLPKANYLQPLVFEFGQSYDLQTLKQTLYFYGYRFVDIVESSGEVSIRGDIVDIFPPNATNPFRLSFFDDEVESIRVFDVQSQKSDPEELESFEALPAFLSLNETQYQSIEQKVQKSDFDVFYKDIESLGFWYLEDFGVNLLQEYGALNVTLTQKDIDEHYEFNRNLIDKNDFNLKTLPEAKQFKEIVVVDINEMLTYHKGKKITLIGKNETVFRRSNVKDIHRCNHIYSDVIINLVSPKELIISLNQKQKPKKTKKSSIMLDELNIGDLVVHEDYGIGKFRSVEKRSIMGATREFVVIEYQNKDQLLVPVESLNLIDRFVSSGGVLPVVDKLGKNSFKRIKEKVKEKLFAIADELIKNAAKRLMQKACVLQTDELEIFQAGAGFEYTDDQKRAVKDIADDLASAQVMDRLLSGDVGFGKTEVAMNAIFIAAKSGAQSVMVVPTTLLANQHYKSIKGRLSQYGIGVAKVDRFVSAAKKSEIKEALKKNEIDLVIGTHAVLAMEFANLQLVIIDEEHKFGVKQKEALKQLSKNTHLLSMSATPIPRSLNMALSKVKTFSELYTPPSERKGVRTFVKSYDAKLVKEIVLRELRRGGQLFYIYNSIAGIEEKKQQLLEILPKLRIEILHSKVAQAKSEKIMVDFEDGKYDLLLSTTVVESGIHLPKVNSIIVDGADNFGIADLHQLRGRVGRGDKEGFAYFLVQNKDNLTEQSQKRLLALESHSHLGSGAVLAMHDLEIRGGGNIIGEAQSGNIKHIGYGLYLKMLEDAIRILSNEEKEDKEEVEIKLTVTAFLNEELISEDRIRLELYRRLTHCESVSEIFDIEEEIVDRFGKLDIYSKQFLDLMVIKLLSSQKKIKKLANYEQNVTIEFVDGKKEYLKSRSKDDDDILAVVLEFLRR